MLTPQQPGMGMSQVGAGLVNLRQPCSVGHALLVKLKVT